MSFTPQQHFGPYLTTVRACSYMEMSENTFRRIVEIAGIDKVPFIRRWAKSDLDDLKTTLRHKAAEEASAMLAALNSEKLTFSNRK